jgi:hypothetical protein
MRSRIVLVLALGVIFLTSAVLWAQRERGQNPARYGWLSSLEEGKAEAKKTGKPLMVVIRCVP